MLICHYSNRLENLALALAEVLKQPPRHVLAEEVVIVQSLGMARWLSLLLAERLGVCANVRFAFPAAYTWEALRALLGNVPETTRFDKPVLVWRVMDALQSLDDAPHFAPLHAYLQGHDELRRYQLARRIADVYDQYLVYRPDWIERWEQGEEAHWQAALWRRLTDFDNEHRATYQRRFFHAAAKLERAPEGLPQRLLVLGISALPPVQLAMLAQLGKWLDVHLLLLNPCQEYWGDILADRDIARREDVRSATDESEQYLAVGNPLLASLGKQGRDFIDLVQEYDPAPVEDYAAAEEESLLHCLQADILSLHRRGEDFPQTPLTANDRSVQIHACHSALREVEVLHDQLLALFASDPGLRPADVIVMTPDIDAYGPTIEAVFAALSDQRRIPFTIADRGARSEYPLVEAFFLLLELARSRYDANRLLALLEYPAVRQRFSLSEDDLGLIRHWVHTTGIRWGVDQASRAELELPATREHTWQAGLERLVLGYALTDSRAGELHQDILPYADIEGSHAQIMGRWHSFVSATFGLRALASQPPAQWLVTLHELIDAFFLAADSDEEQQLQLLRTALAALNDHAERAEFRQPVPLEVIRTALRQHLDQTSGAVGFLAGGVTFCTLVPMRSIPFQVVGLIGMNSDSYPRPQQPLDFDLMVGDFRKGDRSRRQDDRYLFLEALLSARRCLYISYVGNDSRDNSVIPPAVLVSELLDVIEQGFTSRAGSARAQVLRRHPLHAFSPRYFDGSHPALFSYAEELVDLSRQTSQRRQNPPPFIDQPLPEPEPAWRQIDLIQLRDFFVHPARYWLRERLDIQLQASEELLRAHEPFVLDKLGQYQLRTELLALKQQGQSAQQALAWARGAARLPHGQVGSSVFEREWDSVERYAARLRRFLPPAPLTSATVVWEHAGFRLSGRIEGLAPGGYFGYRPGKLSARDYLWLWLNHLLLNAARPAGVEPRSHWLSLDQSIVLKPVGAAHYLPTLLDLYWQGLKQPLRFFPKSALAYVVALRNPANRSAPEGKAHEEWAGNDHKPGEGQDPYYQLAWRGLTPLDAEFTATAQRVLGPLFEHLEAAEG